MNSSSSLFHSSSGSLTGIDDDGIRRHVIPVNKESAWVYPKGVEIVKDKSKTHQGIWQDDNSGNNNKKFTVTHTFKQFAQNNSSSSSSSNKKKTNQPPSMEGEEVWIFRKDDPQGIDSRVLNENPIQGKWGYAPAVKKKKRGDKTIILQKNIDPLDMWFYPPNTKESDIPSNCTIMGDWIKPQDHNNDNDMTSAPPGVKGKVGSQQWNMFGNNNKERRKIIPGKKKSDPSVQTSSESKKVPPKTSNNATSTTTEMPTTPKMSSSKTATTSKKKKAVSKRDSSLSNSSPPSTPAKKSESYKPSSTATLDSSMSSILSTPQSAKRNSRRVLPTSPGSLQSSISSITSSKRALGSDDFQIMVRRQPTLEVFPLIVQPNYKIAQVKQKINRTRGIPMDEIKLSHKDRPLDKVGPKETLTSLGIRNRDTVDLAGFTLYIRTLKGKKYVLNNIDVELPVDKLRELAAEKDKTPVEKIGLYFNKQVLQCGTPLTRYKVKSKSVIELKYDSAGIIAAEQKVYTRRADVPRRQVAPSAQPPPKKPSITLKKTTTPTPEATIEINVIPAERDGTPVKLTIGAKDTTDDVLRKAAKKVGVLRSDLVLIQSDGSTIADGNYQPQKGDTLRVAPIVTIELPDQSFVKTTLVPGQNNTLEDIKRQILESHDIPMDAQVLVTENNDDDNNDKSEQDSAVTRNKFFKLHIKRPSKTISVRGPDEMLHTIVLEADETSLDLWKKVGEAVGIPLDELCLAMDESDEELDQDEYTPNDGDVLAVVVPPSTITVTLPNGDKFELEVMPTATIAELKEVLEEETGTTQDQHKIFLVDGDVELSDDMQLSEDMDLRLELKVLGASAVDIVENEPATETINVTIRKADGQMVQVQLDQDISAMDARKLMSDQTGIPIQDLRLSKDGSEELKKGYVPTDGDVLKIIPPRLSVKTAEGDIIHLDILPNDTEHSLRCRIAQKVGLPASELALLKGEKKVEEGYLPSNGDELRLKPRKISVLGLDGTFFQIAMSSDDTPESIRRKISKEASIPLKDVVLSKDEKRVDAQYMPSSGEVLKIVQSSISITLPDGSCIKAPTRSNSTVASIKEYIEHREGIKKCHITLVDADGKELNDDLPVGRDSEVHVQFKKNEITIKTPDENAFTIEIDANEAVKTLRDMISTRLGIPSQEIRLSMEDEELSGSFVLSNGDVVTIEPPSVVVSLPNGATLELAASKDTTVADIKEVLKDETGVSIQKQKLFVEGGQEPMEDETAITKDLKIRMEVEEVAAPKEAFTVTVQSPNEQTFSIEIFPDDSFLELKRKVARSLNVPIKDLRLSKDEVEIGDDFQPMDGDSLYILSPTITVELPNQELVELEALPETTIGDIKLALEEETGIAKDKQHIFLSAENSDIALSDDTPITKDLVVKLEESTQVKVKDFVGNEIAFDIAPRSDMKSLRSQIATKIGMQAKDLRLINGNEEVKSCSFSNGDVLTLLPPRVIVRFPDGSKREFPVLPTQKIIDLKKLIERKTGMGPGSQRIFFYQKDDELDDSVIFSRSDFVDRTILQVRYDKPEVTVLLPDGRKLSMELEFSDTKNDVRFKVAREIGGGIAAQDLRLLLDGKEIDRKYKPITGHVLSVQAHAIKVEMPDGSKISLTVIPTQTIADIKDMIEQITGLPMDSLCIFLKSRTENLADDEPVSRFDFDNSTILEVRSPDGSPEVEVQLPDGNSFHLVIDTEKSLSEIKKIIEEQFGLPIGEIKLNGELLQAPDTKPLLSYLGTSIRSDSVIRVEAPEMTLALPISGKRVQLKVLPNMTVGDLKKRLIDEHPEVAGTWDDYAFRTSNSGEEVDDRTSVKNLDFNTTFNVEEKQRSFEVFVERQGFETFSISVMPSDDIDDVKERISSITNVSPEHQHLTFNGAALREGKSLREQGLKGSCSISLEPMQLQVKLSNGTPLDFSVKPTYDIRKVKDLICEETSIDPANQTLLFDGKVLKDKMAISDIDVCSGDVLQLETFGISVLCWSGDVIELNGIERNSSIDDVMEMVTKTKGVPKEKQRITRGGQDLSKLATKTLRDLDIQNNDVLMLDNPEKMLVTTTPTKRATAPFSFLKKATNILSSPKVHVPDESQETVEKQPVSSTGKEMLAEEKEGSESSSCEEASASSDEESIAAINDTFTITVITPDITPVTVDISTSDSPSDVRSKISEQVGISMEILRLSRHGHDSIVDEDFIPCEGDILTVEPPSISITSEDGSTFELSALLNTTINDVKKYLQDQTGTPIDLQKLVLADGNGESLTDDAPITKDVHLILTTNNSMAVDSDEESEIESSTETEQKESFITIALPDGKVISVEITRSDLARDIRKKIAKAIGTSVKNLRLSKNGRVIDKKYLPSPGDSLALMPPDLRIALPDGSKLTMPAVPSTTIDDVKAFLERETGTSANEQELYYYGLHGKDLLTEIPSSNEDIDIKLQVTAKKQPRLITIQTPDEESFVMEVKDSDTAKEFRKRVAKRAGFSMKGLRLTMSGIEVDAKYLPLHGDVLRVEPPVVVIEFMDGETMELEAMPGTTVEDIKDILEEEMGILKSNQKLVSMESNGKEWEDDRSITKDVRFRLIEFEEEELYDEITLDDSIEDIDDGHKVPEEQEMVHLDDGSPIKSPRRQLGMFEIHVHEPKGGYKHTFEFKAETTIDDIKIKIPFHARVAENTDDQVITLNGVPLDNQKTLSECNVKNGDVLTLEKYCINISHFGVENVEFDDISYYDTVGALKGKLARQQSLSKDQQQLTIQGIGTILDDNFKTLKQYGVEHGAVLILQEDTRSSNTRSSSRDDEPSGGTLEERLAKIKERAEARKRAKAGNR
ncbi:ubiquitin family protein [Nitzschia inconspicua]|uniref:Ubiquitin family protein n=1 Tax=Nitzschia inconspicua TaxID=303405 RepID=A0A9K3KGD9_9STRA|nr:ubiquitin family protein [Nitzschia inconspicua]